MASQVLQVSAMNSNVPFRSNMGAILLIGLDVKNGIILIEYIGQLRDQGMPLHEALLKAGRTRFRPILMTSLCTILGLVPLAMGFGPGADAAALGDCRHRGPDHQHAAHSPAHPGRIPGLEGPHGVNRIALPPESLPGQVRTKQLAIRDARPLDSARVSECGWPLLLQAVVSRIYCSNASPVTSKTSVKLLVSIR